MKLLEVRNVSEAYARGLEMLQASGVPEPSRAGDVIVMPCPVVTAYAVPTERVLTDPRRDANPFFHLFEALWMLAGRNDAPWLDQFVGDFSKRFGETDRGGDQWGAYGHRWRNHWDMDQLDVVVRRLLRSPVDRRVVIQMWDPHYDLWDPEQSEASMEPRDVPCNTQAYPRLRQIRQEDDFNHIVLDLTICCRSNDMIWGGYGANAVHFSILQEYLAGRLGVGVGKLYQLSNNYHAYRATMLKVGAVGAMRIHSPYNEGATPLPMGTDWSRWDEDLQAFMNWSVQEDWGEDPGYDGDYANSWFRNVAEPMLIAHDDFKAGQRDSAMGLLSNVDATDWRQAAWEWMLRRMGR